MTVSSQTGAPAPTTLVHHCDGEKCQPVGLGSKRNICIHIGKIKIAHRY